MLCKYTNCGRPKGVKLPFCSDCKSEFHLQCLASFTIMRILNDETNRVFTCPRCLENTHNPVLVLFQEIPLIGALYDFTRQYKCSLLDPSHFLATLIDKNEVLLPFVLSLYHFRHSFVCSRVHTKISPEEG